MNDFLSGGMLQNILAILGVAATLIIATLAIHKNFVVKENRKEIGIIFRKTVDGLSSSSAEVRMTSAILLRRFFDKKSELGTGGTPFAADSVQVIAALLKTQQTCNFQKVLADSLRYAPIECLEKIDLQKANLSKAFLGGSDWVMSMEGADFFQANLSGASLKGAKLNDAQFYEAFLTRTVLKETELRKANFDSAIIQGINFTDADLRGASFNNASIRDVDFSNAKIEGATFVGARGYGIKNRPSQFSINPNITVGNKKIFISKPGLLDVRQEQLVSAVRELLSRSGLESDELHRGDYDASNVLTKLAKKIDGCNAMIVFGFKAIHVVDGIFRYSTEDMRQIKQEFLSTPWCQVEIGMAAMKRMPILLLVDSDVSDGVFDETINDDLLVRLDIANCLNMNNSNVLNWLQSIGGEVGVVSHPECDEHDICQ